MIAIKKVDNNFNLLRKEAREGKGKWREGMSKVWLLFM